MADFSNIIQQTNDVIHDNEQGEITSQKLRLLVLDIIDDINLKKLDNLYIKDGNNYYITIGDKMFSIEPYHQTQVVYSDINISSFSYPDISDLGNTSTPTVTYSQTKTTYIDGEVSNTETITSGATKSFSANSILNATLNASTGVVTCNKVNPGNRRLIGNIKITVSMNGKTKTKDADVYQAAHIDRIPDYYVGQLQNRTALNNATDDLLTPLLNGYTILSKPEFPSSSENEYYYFTGTNKLRYVLISNSINTSNVKIDTDAYGDFGDLRNVNFLDIFTQEDRTITKGNKTYNLYRDYNSNYSSYNGFRIKFNN